MTDSGGRIEGERSGAGSGIISCRTGAKRGIGDDGVGHGPGRPGERRRDAATGSAPVTRRPKAFAAWAAAVAAALVAFGATSAAAQTIRVGGNGSAVAAFHELGEAFHKMHPEINVTVLRGLGSSGGIRATLAGQLDIGLSTRPWANEDRAPGYVQRLYARSLLAFAANEGVKADNLTLSEVAEIYSGRKTRWNDGRRIRLVLRPPTDSDMVQLQSMSPQMREAVAGALRREGMIVGVNDEDAADAIEKTPGGFGAATLAIILSEKRRVHVFALDGVLPSVRTLKDGSYPYVESYYMVTKRRPPPAVKALLEFVRSPAGDAILLKNGQVAAQ